MNIDPTDPRLTAYALDELTGDALTEFEVLLREDAEARAEIESIRASAGLLTAGLLSEAGVNDPAIPMVVAPAAPSLKIAHARTGRNSRPVTRALLAAAASVAVVGAGWAILLSKQTTRIGYSVAGSTQPTTSPAGTQPANMSPEQRREAVVALIKQSRDLVAQRRYQDALGAIDQLLLIDPTNDYAIGVRPLVEDRTKVLSERQYQEKFARSSTELSADKAVGDTLRYPANWPDLSERRDRSEVLQLGGDTAKAPQQSAAHDAVALPPEQAQQHSSIGASVNSNGGLTSSTSSEENAEAKKLAASASLKDANMAGAPGGGGRGVGGAVGGHGFGAAGGGGAGKVTSGSLSLDASDAPRYAQSEVNGTFPGRIAVGDDVRARVRGEREGNTEAYDRITDNAFLDARTNPLSTFSIDVDTASYANVRRFLTQGQMPPKDAVRIEEMVNYFPYGYVPPLPAFTGEESREDAIRRIRDSADPFASHVVVASCPWNEKHRLVRVALKGKEIPADQRPPSNLVFLLDVSGSMNEPNKLPLVKESMKQLVEQLGENDLVSIAVYAGNSGLVLQPTRCNLRESILRAIDSLQPGGSTNGAAGITLAYQQAISGFIKSGTNRVILCTDGDFNVGVTDQGSLTRLIEENAKSGVFLSVLGFGMGNVKDSTMEKLADKGNGNYAYIDTLSEGRKVLVEQMTGTLMTIAKDVKIQIEFNPAKVGSYRLIGYENRMLAKEDFNNDKKDAGEIGAGHTVTALYEIAPVGEAVYSAETMGKSEALTKELEYLKQISAVASMPESEGKRMAAHMHELESDIAALKAAAPTAPPVDPLKYQAPPVPVPAATNDLLTLKLRFKPPTGDMSKLTEFPVADQTVPFAQADEDMRFAASVASFGMLLRDSEYKGSSSFSSVRELARGAIGQDASGYRKEFVALVERADALSGGRFKD